MTLIPLPSWIWKCQKSTETLIGFIVELIDDLDVWAAKDDREGVILTALAKAEVSLDTGLHTQLLDVFHAEADIYRGHIWRCC